MGLEQLEVLTIAHSMSLREREHLSISIHLVQCGLFCLHLIVGRVSHELQEIDHIFCHKDMLSVFKCLEDLLKFRRTVPEDKVEDLRAGHGPTSNLLTLFLLQLHVVVHFILIVCDVHCDTMGSL